jgi:hypothetical protein
MSALEPSLKCVVAWSDRRNLCSLVANALAQRVGSDGLRRLGEEAIVVYDAAPPAEVRDWLSAVLNPDESVLVLEFEKWSARGPGVQVEWLMRRGH